MISNFTGALLFAIALSARAESDKLLDYYVEESALFGYSSKTQHIDSSPSSAPASPSPMFGHNGVAVQIDSPLPKSGASAFSYDVEDKVCGDLSMVFTPANARNPARFGVRTQLWGNYFDLTPAAVLTFQMKVADPAASDSWKVAMVDKENRVATTTLQGSNTAGEWKAFSIALKDLEMPEGFNIGTIKLVEFEAGPFADDALVKFDRVGFQDGDQYHGITDKSVDQRTAEERATRQARIETMLRKQVKTDPFAMLYLNEDVDKANQLLVEQYDKQLEIERRGNFTAHWDLGTDMGLCQIYYNFSSRAGKYPGRLSAEVEAKLLELLWLRNLVKNDIHWARQSTWFMDGSENHDLAAKSSCLVSSRIFMNEPDYKDRVYPDHGYGGGYGYGYPGYLGKNPGDSRIKTSGGRANLSDGKKYKAKDHYEAWIAYFKEYIRTRAEHGFFLEHFSPGYSFHTMNMLELIYQHNGDEELTKSMDKFFDLYWAHWIQTSPQGILGGPKTRHNRGGIGWDRNAQMIDFRLGSTGYFWIDDYELPRVLWRMALDREGMGEFVYQSRGIGEEFLQTPRPRGAERSLYINPDSRFLKYTYVTPLYTLGTQMDHPQAVHSHLSLALRWHGMTVSHGNGPRIVPVCAPIDQINPEHPEKIENSETVSVLKTVQHKNTLIFQKAKNYLRIDPDAFPLQVTNVNQMVYVGSGWDEVVEEAGWVFFRKGSVYAAVRPVIRNDVEAGKIARRTQESVGLEYNMGFGLVDHERLTDPILEDSYTWNESRTLIIPKEVYAPFILQCGDKNRYGNFETFRERVKNARLELYKPTVPYPGFAGVVVYTPPEEGSPEMVFNGANMETPQIDGEYIDYSYPMTFDSPYLRAKYGSGKVSIQYGEDELKLDFRKEP
jgi:hypothetical protein